MTDEIEEMFVKAGAVLKGHFLLTSGLHSPVYWEKFKILQYPEYTVRLCSMIAAHYKDRGVQLVAGPTTGGIILAFEVARQLGVRSIYAEKGDDGERVFRRSLTVKPGERVLVVDDILTTGGSVQQVIAAVQKLQGDVIGVGVLVDRSAGTKDLAVPLFACLKAATITYQPDTCPMCAQNMSLVRPGGG